MHTNRYYESGKNCSVVLAICYICAKKTISFIYKTKQNKILLKQKDAHKKYILQNTMVFVKVPDEICRPFTFDDLESFPQNFALIGIGSKFEYFGLGNGKS